jgi:hypothetical protein
MILKYFKGFFMANLIVFKKYIYFIKILYIILLNFIIINKISFFILKEDYSLSNENIYKHKYLSFKNKPLNLNDSLIFKEKMRILDLLSKDVGKNITFLDTLFLTSDCNFGNSIAILNKLLFYCEIISCKTIILDKDIFWYIKNTTKIEKFNISIKVGEKINYKNTSSLYYNSLSLFYSIFDIKPEIRINLIRKEIIKNLNKINTDKNDLYIHIRSGDIFIYPHWPYAQPPLCFYKKILNNNKYNKIYLIAQDKNNPIIKAILKEYSNVIYFQNSLKEDISYLINAYNIVASISSFLNSIIQLNYNLKTIFDYNIYKMLEKILSYHYDLFKYPHNDFINYRMETSPNYNKVMYVWKNNKKQRKLMFKENCINNFIMINISNNK